MNTLLTTTSGKLVDLNDPKPSHFEWMDIAEHLAKQSRFCGASLGAPYSIAQHSCLLADHVAPGFRLQALLHDAHKAFLTEIPIPLKSTVMKRSQQAGWLMRDLEIGVSAAIHKKADIEMPVDEAWEAIKFADRQALCTEVRDILYNEAQQKLSHILDVEPWKHRIVPWKWPNAIEGWMDRLNECLDNPEYRTGLAA